MEFGFEHIYLVPNYCSVLTRSACNISVKFGKLTFANGVIASNMKSVVDANTCRFLAENGMFYIMHRFGTNPALFTKQMHDNGIFSSISIGVNDDSKEQIKQMIDDPPEYITIDVANAYSIKGEYMIKFVKDHLPNAFLTVGNCATGMAVSELETWGADAIKVGIATGSVCTTYNATGFGRPQFSAILEASEYATCPIISDGGIRTIGDISKAFVAGANMVMAGSLFAGYDQSAGEMLDSYKEYYGSASSYNGKDHNIEGTRTFIPYRGDMTNLIHNINDGIRSAVSYSGGSTIESLRNVQWVSTITHHRQGTNQAI